MLMEPKCYSRHCKHYLGIIQPEGMESSERNICEAFPDGIPDEIAYGDDPHDKVWPEQDADVIYGKGPFPWEKGKGDSI